MTPSGILRMDERVYRSHPALSRSLLDKIRKSPAHLKWAMENPDEDTDYFRFGRQVHGAVLEPERFWSSVAIWDGARRAGKVWEDFKAKHDGKELLTAAEERQLLVISDSVRKLDVDWSGIAEGSVFWQYGFDELELKARPDLVSGDTVYDLKTTHSASEPDFRRSILTYGYHRQASWYVDGVEAATGNRPKRFVIIAVEKKPPYAAQTFLLGEDLIELGRQENEANLKLYLACKKSGEWPGYPRQSTISLESCNGTNRDQGEPDAPASEDFPSEYPRAESW